VTNSLLTKSLQEHLETCQKLLDSLLPDIERSGQTICDALTSGKKILLCGNGGSAADAQHIAAELVGCYEKQRRSWPAIALTTDTSALTAVSNDLGYEEVFARQLAGLAQTGDILIAISTSGRSKNVLKAAERARELGCRTIALTGASSDPLGSICDVTVAVPSKRTSRIQEAHITIGHLWCEMVDQIPEQGERG
jgi:D-sedoheptulose 7-phosphate isomerase